MYRDKDYCNDYVEVNYMNFSYQLGEYGESCSNHWLGRRVSPEDVGSHTLNNSESRGHHNNLFWLVPMRPIFICICIYQPTAKKESAGWTTPLLLVDIVTHGICSHNVETIVWLCNWNRPVTKFYWPSLCRNDFVLYLSFCTDPTGWPIVKRCRLNF